MLRLVIPVGVPHLRPAPFPVGAAYTTRPGRDAQSPDPAAERPESAQRDPGVAALPHGADRRQLRPDESRVRAMNNG